MAVFNEPTKWQTSLVNSGDANVIPQSTPVGTGEASFDDGFPQITQIPIGAGGIAPDRKDFNGLFKILGDWIFFNQNGGVPTYSENFDYVAGRVVSYNGNIYKCIQPNGVSSTVVTPGSDTAYWQRLDNYVRTVNGMNAGAKGNVSIMPDFTTTTQIYAPYTASSDGWLFIDLALTQNGGSVFINGTMVFLQDIYSNQGPGLRASGFIPVSKGDVITTSSSHATFNLFFMRCKGAN